MKPVQREISVGGGADMTGGVIAHVAGKKVADVSLHPRCPYGRPSRLMDAVRRLT